MHEAAKQRDWDTYDRIYAQTHDHGYGIVPLMGILVEQGQRERLRVLLAEYINDDLNDLNDLIKHVGYAAVFSNQYGILKMLLRFTSDPVLEPWYRNPDAKPFMSTMLWLGRCQSIPTPRLIKMLERASEAGFYLSDTGASLRNIKDPELHDWAADLLEREQCSTKGNYWW